MRCRRHDTGIALLRAAAAALVLISGIFAAPGVEARGAVPCDIQRGPCILRTVDGTSVELDILPRPVTVMTELTFVVTATRNGQPVLNADIMLDLSMPGMFMGTNRPRMLPVGNGRYEGTGVIMRCPTGKKTWLAEVAVSSAGRTATARFVFEVK